MRKTISTVQFWSVLAVVSGLLLTSDQFCASATKAATAANARAVRASRTAAGSSSRLHLAAALLNAAQDGNANRVAALLQKGVPINSRAGGVVTALYEACDGNHPAVVKLLLEHGASVDLGLPRSKSGGANGVSLVGGATPLIIAAMGVNNIMDGAEAPAPPRGYTGHEVAFSQKHPAEVRAWLQRVETWASGYETIAGLLLDHGANINVQTDDGETAVNSAAESGDPALLKLLLDRGARLDSPMTGYPEAGSTPNMTNGFDALVQAAYQNSNAMVEMLLAHGASPDAKVPEEQTPLTKAVTQGNEQMVAMLIKAGADVNAKSAYGSTPLQCARNNLRNGAAIAAMLVEAGAK